MRIVLEGGPRDGESFVIADSVARSGRVLVPFYGPNGFLWGTAMYEMRRYMPAWAGPCAMPIHRWMLA